MSLIGTCVLRTCWGLFTLSVNVMRQLLVTIPGCHLIPPFSLSARRQFGPSDSFWGFGWLVVLVVQPA